MSDLFSPALKKTPNPNRPAPRPGRAVRPLAPALLTGRLLARGAVFNFPEPAAAAAAPPPPELRRRRRPRRPALAGWRRRPHRGPPQAHGQGRRLRRHRRRRVDGLARPCLPLRPRRRREHLGARGRHVRGGDAGAELARGRPRGGRRLARPAAGPGPGDRSGRPALEDDADGGRDGGPSPAARQAGRRHPRRRALAVERKVPFRGGAAQRRDGARRAVRGRVRVADFELSAGAPGEARGGDGGGDRSG